MKTTKIHIVFLLVLIYLVGVGLRYLLFVIHPDSSRVPFQKESASHYRYAKMIAEGRKVPTIDYQMQHPEGLKVTNDSIFEEYMVGYLYRILPLGHIPFHRFVSYFVMFFSSLSIVAVYLVSYALTRHTAASLIATLMYTISLPALLRNVGLEFAREHVALPFIFFHVYFFLEAIRCQERTQLDKGKLKVSRDRRDKELRRSPGPVKTKSRLSALQKSIALSGACIFLALASWKLTRFYLLLFSLYLLYRFFVYRDVRLLKIPALGVFSFAFLGSVVIPHLRDDLFITSLPMLIFYGILLLYLIEEYIKPVDSRILRAMIGIGILAFLYLFLPQTDKFNHVLATTFYKVRFLLKHPEEPSRLPYEARLYWVPGYTSPSVYDFLSYFLLLILAGGYGVFHYLKKRWRREISFNEEFLLYSLATLFVGYLFFERIQVFVAFFLAIFIASTLDTFLKKTTKKLLLYGAVVAVVGLQLSQVVVRRDLLGLLSPLQPPPALREIFLETNENVFSLLDWIRKNTSPNSAILTYWHTSADILVYAERPTILHTFFEDARARRRTFDFAVALHSNEESFHAFCLQNKVDYFVYSARFLLEFSILSTRYLADKLAEDQNSFAFNAHFHPEKLKYFDLSYQNECFRVYKVLREDDPKESPILDYQPIFDARLIPRTPNGLQWLGQRFSTAYRYYYSALQLFKHQNLPLAVQYLGQAVNACPYLVKAYELTGLICEQQRYYSGAIAAYQAALQLNPNGPNSKGLSDKIAQLEKMSNR